MDALSQLSFRLALIASAGAALMYWLAVAMPVWSAAGVGESGNSVWRNVGRRVNGLGRIWALAAAAFLLMTLAARWQAAGRAPWSNMWEFTVAFAAAVAVAYVLFEYYQRGTSIVGAVVQPVVLALLVAAVLFFPSRVEPLVPALQSQGILAAHVGFMVAAYGVLTLSFGASALRLAQGSGARFARLPRAQVLDDVAYTSVVVGFPLLTLGLALGAYWANSAWGRYWGWDPKETASLVTWLIYGAYLHMHGLRSWRGTRAAVALLVGYAAVLFTYFGVNLWISGLHSYT
jgi:cytochrome c-type biogenesis protein CcsB